MATLLLVIKYLPLIFELVKSAENAIPGEGKGPKRLALVLGILTDILEDAQGLIPTLTKIVNRVVAFFNAEGWK